MKEAKRWQREVAASLEPYVPKLRKHLPTLSKSQAEKLTIQLWQEGFRPMFTKYIRECASCKKELLLPEDDDNALHVVFTGGYGAFVDDYGEEPIEAWLCHECAHKACAEIPWMNEIVNPHKSHSHTQAYHDAHPDHFGWDYDKEKEREE